MAEEEYQRITIRLPQSLREELERKANLEDRSLSAEVRLAIRSMLRKQKSERGDK